MNSADEKIQFKTKSGLKNNKLSAITMSYAFIFLLLLCLLHNYQGVKSKQTAETCKQMAKPTKYGFNNVILNNQSITIATPIYQQNENKPQKQQQFIIRNVTSHR